jgi:hypothetical protein
MRPCAGLASSDEWTARGGGGIFNVMRYLGMLAGPVEALPKQYAVDNRPGRGRNSVILRPREGGLIVPDAAVTAQTSFGGQPVTGVTTLGRMLSPYDLTMRQTFDAPFTRTLARGRVCTLVELSGRVCVHLG